MMKEVLKEPVFTEEIVNIVRSSHSLDEMREELRGYHENDIAQSFEILNRAERNLLYTALDAEWLAEVISYLDNPSEYIEEIGIVKLAEIINEMDADDAIDLWEDIDESVRVKLRPMIDDETKTEIRLINSYDDDEIGSLITTNYIRIRRNLTIRQAMHELIQQAGDNDNISTIYVVSESIEKIKDYAEDSLPVLNQDHRIIGIITAQDVTEAVDDEISEDYAKLAGLSSEEDLNETTQESVKKRLPWLVILLFLGMVVSSVVGAFEGVVAILPVVICFQSMVLDMAGNVGTQSLAVTIRVLMDENLDAKDKWHLIAKEMKVGFCNGTLLGVLSVICLGVYIALFKGYTFGRAMLISGCVGISLLVAIVISSLVGTLVPMFFHKVKVDPAVASGPLITTVNDLVAVVTYYGLAWLFLIEILHIV